MSDQFPYTFGKYQVDAEIGRGGFGSVFRALDTELNRFVAVKILDPIYLRDRRWVARFRLEAQAMAKLDHPHIVPIYDTGEQDGRLFLAMMLVEGPSLSKIIRENERLSWENALEITCQVAEALDYAHELGIIHRDLKPGNILFSDSDALLSDFGLAKIVEDNEQSISMSGSIAGTYNYMAPEVFKNEDATPASDVYALGCVVYEMIVGNMLFDGKTPGEIVNAHIRGITIDDPLPDGTPPGARRVLQKALAKDPEKRYPTTAEFANELLQISTDRLAESYANLKQAITSHRWQEAVILADEINEVDPTYRDVEELQQRASNQYKIAQRRYWAAQWQTSAEQALAMEDFGQARDSLARWRHVDPEDPRLPIVERELLLAEQYVHLQDLIAEGDWQTAQEAAAAIYAQNNNYRNIVGLQTRIYANLDAQKRELAAESAAEERPSQPLAQTPPAVEGKSGIPKWIWVAGIIVLILIVIFVLYSLL